MSIGTGAATSPGEPSIWPHRLAIVLACATFPLLFIGGLVTSKGAGLAVPDWPTTFGHNMFFYPWSKMVGNIFYEHSHRLVASAVGVLTIALTLAFWLRERRHWLRRLGVAALLLVILQGVIGGLRVVLLESTLAIVHAAFAQAFFALTVSLAIFSAVLRHTGERVDAHLFFALLVTLHVIFILVRIVKFHFDRPKLTRPGCFLAVLLLLQLMLGAGSYFGKFTSMLGLPMGVLVLLTTTHLVTGALMLATSLLLTLKAYRLSTTSKASIGQK